MAHTNSLLYSFLASFLAKPPIINFFLSEATDWPKAFGKCQQIVFPIVMSWKGNCKQLDLLVQHMNGNDDTIFLAEA